jgi:hypothetical protein
MALYIALFSIVFLAYGMINYLSHKSAVKRYFKQNGLTYLLVCSDKNMQAEWRTQLDNSKYQNIQIVSLDEFQSSHQPISKRDMERAVRMCGVMRYPCLMTISDSRIEGKHFELDTANNF